MLSRKNSNEACDLFNAGILKVQDAIAFEINGYILNCNNGKVTGIEKEIED